MIKTVLKPWLLAFAAGALSVVGFAPFSLFPAPIFALAVLFYLWLDSSPKQALRNGWFFGLGLMGTGVFWLYISIGQLGTVNTLTALLINLLFVQVIALYFAAAGWLCAKLRGDSPPVALLVLFPAIWALVEWTRGWFLTGFPWLALGYSQIDSPLAGFAPLLGVYGVGWLTACSAGLLVILINGAGVRRSLIALILVSLWGGGWILRGLDWTRPEDKPVAVAVIQGNIAQKLKWKKGQLVTTLELFRDLTRENWDADLIIWPETAVPTFRHLVSEVYLQPLAEEARQNQSALLLGVPVYEESGGRYFNAMLSLGQETDTYYKRHLVPFGEYFPWRSLLKPVFDRLAIPLSDFSPGPSDKALIRVNGYQVGVSICYEDAFGEEVIVGLPEADFLVNASNDAWFGDSLAPHQHLEIARMRALETGRYLVRATNTGISAVIDPKGHVLAASPAFQPYVLRQSIQVMNGMTPYARIGNRGILVILLAVAVTVGWQRSRRRQP